MPHAPRTLLLAFLALLGACAAPQPRTAAVAEGTRARLALLESTDLHSNVLSFDYYRLAEDKALGFERMATLVAQARSEYPNTLLFDAGDTIQGTALADYEALVRPIGCDEELGIYRAMDALGYDGGTIGNHEFNYGLPYLAQVTGHPIAADGVEARTCAGPHFPLVLSNAVGVRDGRPIYPPYAVLDRTLKLTDAAGHATTAPIRVGIIGFTPPPIVEWDRRNLDGKVTTLGVVEAARRYVPELRAKGVDLVVAISHGGLDTAPYGSMMENANWYLAQEPGVDVLLLGHSHAAFPDPANAQSRFATMAGVDNQRGFVHGKPAVMANFFGRSLGVVDLALVRKGGHWSIDAADSHSEVRDVRRKDGSSVDADPRIAPLVAAAHAATVDYVSQPIGDTDFAITSYFTELGNTTALQVINDAQRDYVERYVAANLPQYAGIPILSAAAPFKTGFSAPDDYTDIEPGPLAVRSAADIYLYPNTLTAVKIDGAVLKAWLEHAAGRFNRIDAAATAPQELVNRKFSGYNFDVIQGGLRYAIDVTQAPGERIRELAYQGRPVEPGQAFIVVTNNYRASGGGHFPGLDGSNIIVSAPDANRDVVIAWVRARKHLVRATDGADRPWRFVPVRTAGPVLVTSASGKLAQATAAGIEGVSVFKDNGDGSSTYAVDLAAGVPAAARHARGGRVR
ncbi:bifunctional 2',3'-cyclic-nucleotide 2'-phosphodiesterase/3'-nucleotidase [Dokdonella sp.]|uniref:bifunctional 2',3'-cyclic-nucleotide 2'-phosphodiesterase/3'-nucleotidase n=1 Tax=Dokdonella sp. TaxID=2291710 RepID=UPI002F3E697D